jgi:hypothetical protein
MKIRELNRLARIRSVRLAVQCGCRNARVHFGVARAQIEITEEVS